MYNLNLMMSISVKPKKRGRPATGRDPLVAVRMPPDLTAAIDAFAEEQQPPASRSEAVRALVSRQLIAMGRIVSEALHRGAQEAPTEATMASDAADEALAAADISPQAKAARRREEEPAVIGKARGKGHAALIDPDAT